MSEEKKTYQLSGFLPVDRPQENFEINVYANGVGFAVSTNVSEERAMELYRYLREKLRNEPGHSPSTRR